MEDTGELYLTEIDKEGHRIVKTIPTPGSYGYDFPENALDDFFQFYDAIPLGDSIRTQLNLDAAYETAFGIRDHFNHDFHSNPIPLFTKNPKVVTDSVRDAVYTRIVNYGLPKLTGMGASDLLKLHPAEFARWFKIAKQNDAEKSSIAKRISDELDD